MKYNSYLHLKYFLWDFQNPIFPFTFSSSVLETCHNLEVHLKSGCKENPYYFASVRKSQ